MMAWFLVLASAGFFFANRWAYLQTRKRLEEMKKQEEDFRKAHDERLVKIKRRGRRTNGRIL